MLRGSRPKRSQSHVPCTLLPAVFIAKVSKLSAELTPEYKYTIHVSKWSRDRKAQPFYGLSVFGMYLCEGALKALLQWGSSSRSATSYQRTTDGYWPESDQLTNSCEETEGGRFK